MYGNLTVTIFDNQKRELYHLVRWMFIRFLHNLMIAFIMFTNIKPVIKIQDYAKAHGKDVFCTVRHLLYDTSYLLRLSFSSLAIAVSSQLFQCPLTRCFFDRIIFKCRKLTAINWLTEAIKYFIVRKFHRKHPKISANLNNQVSFTKKLIVYLLEKPVVTKMLS